MGIHQEATETAKKEALLEFLRRQPEPLAVGEFIPKGLSGVPAGEVVPLLWALLDQGEVLLTPDWKFTMSNPPTALASIWCDSTVRVREAIWNRLPERAYEHLEKEGVKEVDLQFLWQKTQGDITDAVAAIRVLATIAEDLQDLRRQVMDGLLELLAHPSPQVRNAVAEACWQVAVPNPEAVVRLREAASIEKHPAVQRTLLYVANLLE